MSNRTFAFLVVLVVLIVGGAYTRYPRITQMVNRQSATHEQLGTISEITTGGAVVMMVAGRRIDLAEENPAVNETLLTAVQVGGRVTVQYQNVINCIVDRADTTRRDTTELATILAVKPLPGTRN